MASRRMGSLEGTRIPTARAERTKLGRVVSNDGGAKVFELAHKMMRRMKTVLNAVGITLRGLIVSAAIMESLREGESRQRGRKRRGQAGPYMSDPATANAAESRHDQKA